MVPQSSYGGYVRKNWSLVQDKWQALSLATESGACSVHFGNTVTDSSLSFLGSTTYRMKVQTLGAAQARSSPQISSSGQTCCLYACRWNFGPGKFGPWAKTFKGNNDPPEYICRKYCPRCKSGHYFSSRTKKNSPGPLFQI